MSAMPRATSTEKLVCALYTHGPCGAGTLAALIGEKDSRVVEMALRPMVPSQVDVRPGRRAVLPGRERGGLMAISLGDAQLDDIEASALDADSKNVEKWGRFSDATEPDCVLAMVREIRRLRRVIEDGADRAYVARILDNATDHDHRVAIDHVQCRICGAEPGSECVYGQLNYGGYPLPPTGVRGPVLPVTQYPGKAHTRRLLAGIHFQMTSPAEEAVRLENYEDAGAEG